MTANVVRLKRPDAKKAPTTLKFTSTSLRKATADLTDTKGVILRDAELRGFILRKQNRDWVFGIERKIGGKIWRIALEPYTGGNNIPALRSEVTRIYGEIAAGTYTKTDPVAAAGLAGMTVGGAVDLHITANPQLKPKTILTYRAAARKLGEARRMADIDATAVRVAYDALVAADKAATGNQMVRSMSAIWSTWAAEHPDGQEPTRNPTLALTRKRGRMVKIQPREGAIPIELRRAWFEAAQARSAMLGHTGAATRAVMLLFLTGMRVQEILGLEWSEIRGDTMTVSAGRMKGAEALARPITQRMREILDQQPTASRYVFPAGDGHLRDIRKALWAIGAEVFDDPKAIRPHDLRRTYIAAGMLAAVPDVGVKMLVGHTTRDITEAYARALRPELPRFAAAIESELLR